MSYSENIILYVKIYYSTESWRRSVAHSNESGQLFARELRGMVTMFRDNTIHNMCNIHLEEEVINIGGNLY